MPAAALDLGGPCPPSDGRGRLRAPGGFARPEASRARGPREPGTLVPQGSTVQ